MTTLNDYIRNNLQSVDRAKEQAAENITDCLLGVICGIRGSEASELHERQAIQIAEAIAEIL